MRVAIEWEWSEAGPVQLDAQGRNQLPKFEEIPGVYRFAIAGVDGPEVYIGQAEDLSNRLPNYRRAHQGATNVRIRTMLQAALQAGYAVQLSVITHALLSMGDTQTLADLTRKDVRLLIENAALVEAQAAGVRVHNLP